MQKKPSIPIEILRPLCAKQGVTSDCPLQNFGTSPIFDRNVIGIVAQFLVGVLFRLFHSNKEIADVYSLVGFSESSVSSSMGRS